MINQINIDQKTFINLIQEFWGVACQTKNMLITSANEVYMIAESPVINNEVFGIENFINEERFVLHLIKLNPETGEKKIRRMSITYKECIIDLVKNNFKTMLQVIENQWDLLRKMTDDQWNELTKKHTGKLTFVNPTLQ